MKPPTEAQEAKLLIQLAFNHKNIYIRGILKNYFFHVPNGGKRSKREAAELVACGVKAGVSDYLLLYPVNGKHGLSLELKRREKKFSQLTSEQQLWLECMNRINYVAVVAYGADDALLHIENYLLSG